MSPPHEDMRKSTITLLINVGPLQAWVIHTLQPLAFVHLRSGNLMPVFIYDQTVRQS
jgi:hypothetical protein